MPNMVVVCYDFDGKEIWRKSPGKLLSTHGFCTSPVLYKNLVILNGDQDAVAYIVALDKNTGAERSVRRPAQPYAPLLHTNPHSLRQASGNHAVGLERQQIRGRL